MGIVGIMSITSIGRIGTVSTTPGTVSIMPDITGRIMRGSIIRGNRVTIGCSSRIG